MRKLILPAALLLLASLANGCKKPEPGAIAIVNNHPSCYIVVRVDGGDPNTINIGSSFVYEGIEPGHHSLSIGKWQQGDKCDIATGSSQCDFEVDDGATVTVSTFEDSNNMIGVHCPQ